MGIAPFVGVAELAVSPLSAQERLRRLEEAKAFLRRALASGPQPASTLLSAAAAEGIAEGTLYHAKKAVGVISAHRGYGAGSQWMWAASPGPVPLPIGISSKASTHSG
jgi:hypothetical protein